MIEKLPFVENSRRSTQNRRDVKFAGDPGLDWIVGGCQLLIGLGPTRTYLKENLD